MKEIKIKYNHINNNEDYLKNYLLRLGIKPKDISSFLEDVKETDEDNPLDLLNLEYAVRIAYDLLNKENTKVFVQVDSDTDGYTSSAVLINYLHYRFPNIEVRHALHPGKEHGIVPAVIDDDVNLVFIPDAGSNDYIEQKELIQKGKTVIILDHHEVNNYENTGAILVNNQFSPAFSNKFLSGVGIVYMFIKQMDKEYFSSDPIYSYFRDLTAIGIIADAMNMTTLGNNFLAKEGLSHINNSFIQELAIKQSRGIKNPSDLTKMDVAFYIAPVINGVIRSGSPEDKEMVFKALTTKDSQEEFLTEWRGKTRNENLYQYAVRLATNAKSRQDNAKKKSFEWLCEKIITNGWDKYNLIIATLDEKESTKVSPNITGLIAMELVKKFNKPCLVLRETDFEGSRVYGGSGRNGVFYGLPSLLDFIHNSNFAKYAEGHANAFGVFIEPENIQKLREYSLKKLESSIFEDKVFEVDYWFHTDEIIDKEMLFTFASAEKLWGNGIPKPTFAFDFNLCPDNCTVMGAHKNTLKISHDKVDFISFNTPSLCSDIESMQTAVPERAIPIHCQVIGTPTLNEWMGRVSVQVLVENIELTATNNTRVNIFDLI